MASEEAKQKYEDECMDDYFARKLVENVGADEARKRTCGPMFDAVERAIAQCEDEAREHEYERGMLHG
jgi:hypothetical protein